MPPVVVHEVGKGVPWRQFVDLRLAFLGEPPDARWLLTAQRKRLTSSRFAGEAACFLARRGVRPVGRITAHFIPGATDGFFGFFAVEGPTDTDVTGALVTSAASWLADHGCGAMTGPVSWTADEEAGVLVGGSDPRPVTGRAWTPPWYGDLLAAAGLDVLEELRSYQLPAGAGAGLLPLSPADLMVADDLAPYADPALLLKADRGDEAVVAVPDVAAALAGGSARRAWSLAKRARTRAWEGCVVLALEGDPSVVVPTLCAAAGRAGYSWVVSPWAPAGTDPALIHRLYHRQIGGRGLKQDGSCGMVITPKLGRVAPAPSQAQGEA
jgi:hypothetical protein